jgi:hypothetical protein
MPVEAATSTSSQLRRVSHLVTNSVTRVSFSLISGQNLANYLHVVNCRHTITTQKLRPLSWQRTSACGSIPLML